MTFAIILFALTYVLMISFGKYRTWFALVSGILFVLTGMLSTENIIGSLDFNVLLMIGGIGILRKEGHEVKNSDFFKIGIPFTMSAVIPAYIVLWLLFGV